MTDEPLNKYTLFSLPLSSLPLHGISRQNPPNAWTLGMAILLQKIVFPVLVDEE